MGRLVLQNGPASPDIPGLVAGVKSITLTLSSGVGSVPLPVGTTKVGIYPAASAAGRVGLGEAPAAIGTATGTAASSDLGLGMPLVDQVWHWFDLTLVDATTLYFKGATSGVFTVALV